MKNRKHSWFYEKTEPFFVGLNNIYTKYLDKFLTHKSYAFIVIGIMLAVIVVLWFQIPSEMSPLEDRSQITITTKVPEGATYEYYRDYTQSIANIVDSTVPEKDKLVMFVRSYRGNILVFLPKMQERHRSQMQIAQVISSAVASDTRARAFVQQQSTFGGRRASMPIQYVLQAPNIEKLREFIPLFMKRVNASPLFMQADVDLKFNKPESQLKIDRDKAALLGLDVINVSQTLQYALSGQRLGYFYMNGKQYQIIADINRQQRNKPIDLQTLYVRNKQGEMIQLGNIVDMKEEVAPPTLYHYNRFVSATVTAALPDGVTIGDGLNEMDRIAKEILDESFRTALAGESKEFRESASSLAIAFILALVFIFLILAAQFESFRDPLVIMFTVPLALAGALLFMFGNDVTFNIFSEIGIIMLIGLVVKNGILIVEFANQRQLAGMSKIEAVKVAATQRLRPILMTSLATVLGILPLVFANGEGANGRIAMGTAVVGGMLLSTFLTIFVVPTMYVIIATTKKKDTI